MVDGGGWWLAWLDGGGDDWFPLAATERVQKVIGGLRCHKYILLQFWGQAHGLM